MIKNIMLISKLELFQRRKTIFIWSLVLGAIVFVYMSLFPSFKDALVAEMELMPPELLAMFGMSDNIDYSNFNNYFAMISQIIVIVLCAVSVYLGACLLGDEQSNKTIEYLNANPVSRKEIVLGKALSIIVIIAIINFSQFIVASIGGFIGASDQIAFWVLLKSNLLSMLVMFLFGISGIFISSIIKSGKGQGIGLGFCFGTYIIGYFATLGIKWLKWCKWLSPMDFLSQTNFITSKYGIGSGSFNFIGIAICFIFIVLFLIGSVLIYKKKDL